MRLDYFCPVYVETGSGKALTDPKKLQKLSGQFDSHEDSDLTLHMDEELSDDLIFDPVTLVYNEAESALYARLGFHEKDQLSAKKLALLSKFVVGQFMDGYGAGVWSFRKGLTRYHVHFVSSELDPTVLNYQQTEFVPFPVLSKAQINSPGLVRGPFKTDAPLPKPKPVISTSDKIIHNLHVAAMEGDLDTVRSILEKGIDPDARRSKIDTHSPDFTALCWASNRNQIDVARYLIAEGANIDFPAESGTPIMAAHAPAMITLLLEAGADPAVKIKGLTASEYHRDQARFYLEDKSLSKDWMHNRGKEILALAELIENWHD